MYAIDADSKVTKKKSNFYYIILPFRLLWTVVISIVMFFKPSFEEDNGKTSARRLTGFAFVALIFYMVVSYVRNPTGFSILFLWIMITLIVSVLLMFVVITWKDLIQGADKIKEFKK